jgi:hypothetical protein
MAVRTRSGCFGDCWEAIQDTWLDQANMGVVFQLHGSIQANYLIKLGFRLPTPTKQTLRISLNSDRKCLIIGHPALSLQIKPELWV